MPFGVARTAHLSDNKTQGPVLGEISSPPPQLVWPIRLDQGLPPGVSEPQFGSWILSFILKMEDSTKSKEEQPTLTASQGQEILDEETVGKDCVQKLMLRSGKHSFLLHFVAPLCRPDTTAMPFRAWLTQKGKKETKRE